MKKEDIMPGGKFFPIFWLEIFGLILLTAVVVFIVSFIKRKESPRELLQTTVNESQITENQVAEGEPVPTKKPTDRTAMENLQHELLELYFNTDARYGMDYRGGKLLSETFAGLFFDGERKKIMANDVQIGDYAEGNGISGICVGFYADVPVYVYVSEYNAGGRDDNGVCLGFSREQNDRLFFGMFPVSFTAYYRGYEGKLEEDIFPASVKQLRQEPWYVTDTYEYGKRMSDMEVDYLLNSIMTDRLTMQNMKMHREKFTEFLTKLPNLQGFEGGYDVMVSKVKEKDAYTEVTVAFVPHSNPGMQPMGEWKLTFYPEYNRFLPCGVNFVDYPEVGFVRDQKITITTDEEGKVTVEMEDIIYGQTVDEEGNRIYRFEDGTIVYLD